MRGNQKAPYLRGAFYELSVPEIWARLPSNLRLPRYKAEVKIPWGGVSLAHDMSG